jgi:Zn-finger nucleic acid-binding protein
MENVRRCPRCPNSTTLVGALVGGVMLDRCEECDGIFLDNATLEKLIADRDRQAVLKDSLDGGGLSFPDTSMSGGPVKYLRCPDCAAHMARRNFGRVSKVIVDVCPTHGTWFDKDELRRIIEFVQTGGLDKARKFEIDQLQKEIDRKRETARTAVPVSGFNNATGATWGETALLELVVEGVSALIFWRR